jgi:site-specific DNA recombinase
MAVDWKALEEAKKAVRAVGYGRVSTVDQLKGVSLEYQENKIRKYAEYAECTLVDMYIEKGQSGAREDREELTRLMQDAEAGKFDMVIIWKADRFSRDLGIAVDVYKRLKEFGVTLFILDGNIDTSTPMGKMVFYQLSIFAEMEKDSIRDRLIMGKTDKATKGQYIGKKPYGYDVDEGKLIVNNSEAEAVKTIFKLRAYDRMSLRAIGEHLNNNNYPTPSGKSKEWNHNSVAKIIKNEIYIGEYSTTIEGKKFTGECEPLITKQMFGRANSKY